jgi:acyl carrier protein
MPNQETVEETLKRIVLKVTRKKDANFSGNTRFEELGADSLDRVQVVMAMEEAFDIEILDEEIRDIPDMGRFVELIKGKIAVKAKVN